MRYARCSLLSGDTTAAVAVMSYIPNSSGFMMPQTITTMHNPSFLVPQALTSVSNTQNIITSDCLRICYTDTSRSLTRVVFA